MQRELETRIGRALIAGSVLDGALITVDVGEDGLTVRHEQPEPASA
jgi:ATP-dependent Clp protease ATP-binding subunit ClpB